MRTAPLASVAALSAVFLLPACGNTTSEGASDGGTATNDATASDAGQCVACVTDSDCGNGAVCAQFGGDTYCALLCPNGDECASGDACTTLSTASGDQASACVPTSGPCAGGTSNADAGSPPAMCGPFAGPTATASCHGCGSHACQANGCYGGWYCNTTTNRCQAPPTTCETPDAGGVAFDGGTPVTGTIGPTGGTLSRLVFSIVGDTRPATIDDTAGYPTTIIDGIYQTMNGLAARPPFGVSTGDYMFAKPSGSEAGPQLDLYVAARTKFGGTMFPAMGNHECTGATVSNCGAGNADGVTNNYSAFLSKLLGPLNQSNPYYEIDVNATDGSWTSKFLFVAANAWDSAQAAWLEGAMSKATTYTFVVRHEPSSSSSGPPGVAGSDAIMTKHPYTMLLVGHTHTYRPAQGTRQVLVGNGGAPITGGVDYGFAIANQQADGTIAFDMIDYATGLADPTFHFAVKADGSTAP